MNVKMLAAGIVLIFLAWYISTVSMPWVSVDYWQPFPNVSIPYPTLTWVNPLGFLCLPMLFIGSLLVAFSITTNTAIRVAFLIAITAWIAIFKGAPILGVWTT